MIIDWYFAWEILPILMEAALVTLQATVTGYAIALVLGLLLALLRRSKMIIISAPISVFIEFIRSTPLLVQLFFMYFIFPEYGIRMSPLMTGIIGLGIHYSCYLSEVYRAGLDGIPKGQWEAARALNFGKLSTYKNIIIPQAIPPVVPALGNYLIGMIKDTPLLSAIAVVEIMQQAKIIGSETFRYLEPITEVGLFFLIVSLFFAALVRKTEKWVSLEGKHQ
jgi:polar amino acid transport system permease protein